MSDDGKDDGIGGFMLRLVALFPEDASEEAMTKLCDEIQPMCSAIAPQRACISIELTGESSARLRAIKLVLDEKAVRDLARGEPVEVSGSAKEALEARAEVLRAAGAGSVTDGEQLN